MSKVEKLTKEEVENLLAEVGREKAAGRQKLGPGVSNKEDGAFRKMEKPEVVKLLLKKGWDSLSAKSQAVVYAYLKKISAEERLSLNSGRYPEFDNFDAFLSFVSRETSNQNLNKMLIVLKDHGLRRFLPVDKLADKMGLDSSKVGELVNVFFSALKEVKIGSYTYDLSPFLEWIDVFGKKFVRLNPDKVLVFLEEQRDRGRLSGRKKGKKRKKSPGVPSRKNKEAERKTEDGERKGGTGELSENDKLNEQAVAIFAGLNKDWILQLLSFIERFSRFKTPDSERLIGNIRMDILADANINPPPEVNERDIDGLITQLSQIFTEKADLFSKLLGLDRESARALSLDTETLRDLYLLLTTIKDKETTLIEFILSRIQVGGEASQDNQRKEYKRKVRYTNLENIFPMLDGRSAGKIEDTQVLNLSFLFQETRGLSRESGIYKDIRKQLVSLVLKDQDLDWSPYDAKDNLRQFTFSDVEIEGALFRAYMVRVRVDAGWQYAYVGAFKLENDSGSVHKTLMDLIITRLSKTPPDGGVE